MLLESVELLLELDPLELERDNFSAAAPHRVCRSHVGMISESRCHQVAVAFVAAAEKLEDFADAEELVRVEEALRLVGREVGREKALWGALLPPELARGACWGGGTVGGGGGGRHDRRCFLLRGFLDGPVTGACDFL